MLNLILSKRIFILIFTFSIITFLSHTIVTKTAIFADGKFYYSITRSLVKDQDIKFGNEYYALGIAENIKEGYVWNKYPPGAPIFWTPLFYMTDTYSNILKNIGISIDTFGFGILYQGAVALSTIFLGTLGLYLVYQLLRDYFSEKVSLLTTLALFGTTNLLFYISVEQINSHGVSFFASSLFVFYFLKCKERRYYYLTLGILGGFVSLVRTQDAIILILPIIQIIIDNKPSLKTLTTNYYLLTAGAILGFAPQIYFWKKIFNTFWYSPYVNEGFFFFNPKIGHVLFNTQNGLFILTPVIAVSLLGLLIAWKKQKLIPKLPLGRRLILYSLIYFLLQLYLISSWSSYNQIGSYSIRMIISTYPLLAFGLAAVVKLTKEKIGLTKTFSLISLITLINSLLIIRYLLLY